MSFPPFAPTLDVERNDRADRLPHREAKRTGHLYGDCPGYLEQDALTKAAKPKACPDCQARRVEVGALSRQHQAAFDAAWYAAAAAEAITPGAIPSAAVTAAPAFEAVAWLEVDGDRNTITKVDAAEAWSPAPAARPVKANRYGGRCPLCSQWVAEGAGQLVKVDGKWGAQHLDGACPAPKPAAPAAPAAQRADRPGIYVRSDGRLVRVAISRTSGKPYALLCTLDEHGKDEYLGGGRHLEGLRPATEDEAIAYGKQTIRCCVCGTRLENQESRDLGIGPICRSKAF